MSAISVDVEQGMARDHGELFTEGEEEPVRVVVDISLEEEDQLCFNFKNNNTDEYLFLPADRLRRLLKG